MERALRSLPPSAGASEVTILTSPEEADDIRAVLGAWQVAEQPWDKVRRVPADSAAEETA
jgi:hypothetical protein